MLAGKQKKVATGPQRIRLTIHLTLAAYDALADIQRRHRVKYGRVLPIWKILDAAVKAYAEQQEIQVGE
jgi:hypothetical protein